VGEILFKNGYNKYIRKKIKEKTPKTKGGN
jgi:hypothetical protein